MWENAALVALAAFGILIAAYFTYGRFIADRICRLDPNRTTPSHELQDGVDYVPTRVPILFGHHFASIAGLGPILGPAIAVIWGWGPALLWVLFGCIFIGAVHDLGALFVSLRHQGRSVGEVARSVIGPRARLLSLVIIYFLMALAMGAFCNAIADLFVNFNPDAIIPSVGLMIVAVLFGTAVYRFRAPLGLTTILALAAFAGLIVWGVEQPVCTYQWVLSSETSAAIDEGKNAPPEAEKRIELPYGAEAAKRYLSVTGRPAAVEELTQAVPRVQLYWIVVLLAYGFFASVLPVWLLLQPRDYINSFQLYFALGTMLLGLSLAAIRGAEAAHIEAPWFRPDVPGAPPWFPFLFVTIACGAVSGFHSLVSSGTTVKQLNREPDARPIGFGAMLTEGALAVLVIMACAAGLKSQYWGPEGLYATWKGVGGGGLAAQLSAVVLGGAEFLNQLGIPAKIGRTFLAVTITAFALTTLDSATRLLRFNVEEICRSLRAEKLANRYFASAVAVAGIAFFALVSGKTLWTLFGTANQLLAGLTLLTVSLFLYQLGRPVLYTLVPMVLMLAVSGYAMIWKMFDLWGKQSWTGEERNLFFVSGGVLALAFWLVAEGLAAFARGRVAADGTAGAASPEAASPGERRERQ